MKQFLLATLIIATLFATSCSKDEIPIVPSEPVVTVTDSLLLDHAWEIFYSVDSVYHAEINDTLEYYNSAANDLVAFDYGGVGSALINTMYMWEPIYDWELEGDSIFFTGATNIVWGFKITYEDKILVLSTHFIYQALDQPVAEYLYLKEL